MPEPTVLHVFSDYACPWCYLGRARMKQALDQVGRPIDARIVHFPLAPDTPAEGRAVRPYLEAKGVAVDEAVIHLSLLLEDVGMPYHGDPDTMRTWNTRKAQELAVWAVTQPGGDAIHDALFDAYQVDNVNVSDPDVLVEVARGVGLDGDAARAALSDPRTAAEVDRHWSISRETGVTGVPTFLALGRVVVGAQHVDKLTRLLTPDS